jgi:hypothetical protein
MSSESSDPKPSNVWQSAHVCPNCGNVIDLSELDLVAVTTGIVSCTRCDWGGRIEIQVVDAHGSN